MKSWLIRCAILALVQASVLSAQESAKTKQAGKSPATKAQPPQAAAAQPTQTKKSSSTSKKAGDKKAADKKAADKKAAGKKAVSKKAVSKKAVSKKAVSKKAVSKKAVSKKAASTKAVSKKAVSKKAVSKKAVSKKGASKKAGQKKAEKKAADKKDTSPFVVNASVVKSLQWRSIGPSSMGGRIVDLAVVESNPSTYFVATASGGLFKTANAGVTFQPLFQQENTISIGDVCVAPSNPEIVWIGTGEHNGRNSVSWGDGVYKSVDGGKTWTNMGLKKSFQIGRIVIDPKNPDIVLVGALGRLWGKNEERGIYKTTDGGKTWKQVLFIDDMTGCIDLQMHPQDPKILLAAMYERLRDPYDGGDPVKRFGWGSGLFRSTDGGDTWQRVTKGLPTVKMGRIGLSFMNSKPNVVYALVESERIGRGPTATGKQPALMGIQGRQAGVAVLTSVTGGGAAQRAGLRVGDTIIKIGDKDVKDYNALVQAIGSHYGGDKVKVKVTRGGKPLEVNLTFGSRTVGFGATLGGQQANVQGRQGPEGFQTGGVFKSTDAGDSWQRINSLNPRPFYFSQIRVDPNDEKNIFVLGIRLNRSTDGGLRFQSDAGRNTHPDHHAMWINPNNSKHIILGCDGGLNVSYDGAQTWDFIDNLPIGQFYHVGVGPRAPYYVYGGLQDNGSWGGPSALRGGRGPTAADWFAVGGGDGFVCRVDPNDANLVYYESQYGNMGRVNLKTGARARIRPTERGLRFNWKTPFILSSHNSKIYYCAGNKVFRSLNRGSNLRAISPDITSTSKGTATALAESPINPDALYVGTDDGNLWGTTDGGTKWKKLRVKGVPGPLRVQSLEASRFAAGRAYVAFDGHYYDTDKPYIFVTEDYGKTWKSLNANLPMGSTRVLREDVSNPEMLYLGTEFGIWCSMDRGQHWNRINNNLPHVAVHEIAIHPTAGEIVAATHGRSLWILDVNDLRQMKREVLAKDLHLFQPKQAVLWQGATGKRFYGQRHFFGSNPSSGAVISYCLKKKPKQVTITITDVANNTVGAIRPRNNEAGMNRVGWSLRRQGRTRNRSGGLRVDPGSYLVTLDVDGQKQTTTLTVAQDPEFSASTLTFEEEEELRQEEGEEADDQEH